MFEKRAKIFLPDHGERTSGIVLKTEGEKPSTFEVFPKFQSFEFPGGFFFCGGPHNSYFQTKNSMFLLTFFLFGKKT